MFKLHNHCRACGYAFHGAGGNRNPSEKLVEVFDLGIQPLANDFVKQGEPHTGYAPLKVLYCPRCSLAQLSVVVDPKILYQHYNYVTSPSNMMREHFERLIKDIASEIASETKDERVLEIGSNDGRLLSVMKEKGYDVAGIDPADNLAQRARDNGLTAYTGLFSKELAPGLGRFDIVIARHVFCHVDDWQDFVKGLEIVSHPETLICIEVPYAGDTLKKCEFDTVYHEHLSYLTVKAVRALLDNTSLHLHRIIRYSIHGGAILIMLRHNDSEAQSCAQSFLNEENITVCHWQAFAETAHAQIDRLRRTVREFRSEGKTVAGLGASAKSTVWVNACGFTRNDIAFITDSTFEKQLTTSPGTNIPIVDEGAIMRELPDYLVIFCWNYLSECLAKFAIARSKGVKFIVPVPTIEIV